MSRGPMIFPVVGLLAFALLAGCDRPSDLRADAYEPAPPGTLTYCRDVAPIIYNHCSECHRPGEAAPFQLLTYRDVAKRAGQIVHVVESRFMPPWLPESEPGEFHGQRVLTAQEVGTLVQWTDEGRAEGDAADLPPEPTWPEGWKLGEPDLVVEMAETYILPADGPDVFRNFVLPVPGKGRRYVKAVELRPTNRPVVHHAVMMVDETRSSRQMAELEEELGYGGMSVTEAHSPDGFFLGWTPGKSPFVGENGMAWCLEEGADFVLNLHMPPTGKEEEVGAKVGFYFTDTPPTRYTTLLRLGASTMDIPAGDSDYTIEDRYVLPVDVEVLAVYPHAHFLGREMEVHATLPDGSRQQLLRIPEWDFNWQDEYRYLKPRFLPRGTVLSMTYVYDNSAENVRNPSQPPRRVLFGPQSTDEMGDLWIQVSPRNAGDLTVLEMDHRKKDMESRLAGFEVELGWDLPDNQKAATHNSIGKTLHALGNREKALVHLRMAVQLDPASVFARNNLGSVLSDLGRFGPAVRQFTAALEHDPTNAALIHFNRGRAYRGLDDEERAIADFRTAIRLRPDLDEAHNNLGNVYRGRGDLEPALTHLTEARRLNPRSPIILFNLGLTLEKMNRLDEAARSYEDALGLMPNHEAMRRRLSSVRQKIKNQKS